MNELEYLLFTLSEECDESGQRASKAARFGMSEIQPGQPLDNKRRLEIEVADIIGVARMLKLDIREEDIQAKIAKVTKYMEYSRNLGTLRPDSMDAKDAIAFLLRLLRKKAVEQGFEDGHEGSYADELRALAKNLNVDLGAA